MQFFLLSHVIGSILRLIVYLVSYFVVILISYREHKIFFVAISAIYTYFLSTPTQKMLKYLTEQLLWSCWFCIAQYQCSLISQPLIFKVLHRGDSDNDVVHIQPTMYRIRVYFLLKSNALFGKLFKLSER